VSKQKYPINIVCGVPGTGKSTIVEACLQSGAGFIALDIDWLLESANNLLSIEQPVDLRFHSKSWPAYNALWFEVMHTYLRNGAQPVLFAPITPEDITNLPAWCESINWHWLDCADQVLQERLLARKWSAQEIEDILEDAAKVRRVIASTPTATTSDTSNTTTNELVTAISVWVTRLASAD